MTFAWPLALLGLALVPLLLAAYLLVQRRRARYAMRFTNLDLLANVVDGTPRWRRHLPPALFLLALVALVVAVARPQALLKTPEGSRGRRSRDGRVDVDGGNRRAADPPRGRTEGGGDVSRQGA